MKKYSIVILLFSMALLSFTMYERKPVLYIIGDSTVKNGDGTGKNGQWGWGTVIGKHFDTAKISVQNHAIGGRSSRTFLTDGRWDKILETLSSGDYIIMQFGHNDSGALDDTSRARGTIKGIGEESKEIYNPIRKTKEVVYSYGWYLRKYVKEAQAKGAIPVICSPVPRDNRKDGKIGRSEYGVWAKQVAEQTGAYFIDLQERIALDYEKMDTSIVNGFFSADKTHTNKDGAELNARHVVRGIKDLKDCGLKKFLADK